MQRDALHPPNSLIAFIPVRSPQMLNLDSQAYWQQAARQQMTSFKRVARGRDVKSWQTVRASVHIISRPWQASPCMNSKLVKPWLDSFWSDIHHVDQCCGFTVLCPRWDVLAIGPWHLLKPVKRNWDQFGISVTSYCWRLALSTVHSFENSAQSIPEIEKIKRARIEGFFGRVTAHAT